MLSEKFLLYVHVYQIKSTEWLCTLQGSLHLANTSWMKPTQTSRPPIGLLWALFECLLWSSWCYQVFWQSCFLYKWGQESTVHCKKKLEQKHLNKQIPGLPSSLFLGLMMPDKNRDESDGWPTMRPAICHPIKWRPQGMETAFSFKLSHGASARQVPL